MSIAQEIFDHMFADGRDKYCGPEYKAGVLAELRRRLEGATVECPYATATAQADAWKAGVAEAQATEPPGIAELVLDRAFPPEGEPRSNEYKRGALDHLRVLLDEAAGVANPYPPGSVQADAYEGGFLAARRLAYDAALGRLRRGDMTDAEAKKWADRA